MHEVLHVGHKCKTTYGRPDHPGPRASLTSCRAPGRSSTRSTPPGSALPCQPGPAATTRSVGGSAAEHSRIGEHGEQCEQHHDGGPAAFDRMDERAGRGRGAQQGRRDAVLVQRRGERDEREVVLLQRNAGQHDRGRTGCGGRHRRLERGGGDVGQQVLDGDPVRQLAPPVTDRSEHRTQHVLPGPLHRMGREMLVEQAPTRRPVEVEGGRSEKWAVGSASGGRPKPCWTGPRTTRAASAVGRPWATSCCTARNRATSSGL